MRDLNDLSFEQWMLYPLTDIQIMFAKALADSIDTNTLRARHVIAYQVEHNLSVGTQSVEYRLAIKYMKYLGCDEKIINKFKFKYRKGVQHVQASDKSLSELTETDRLNEIKAGCSVLS